MAYTGSVPDTVPRRLDWQAQALCRTEDPELFFDPARERDAKKACFACPVLVDCQTWVMAVERGHGLYHRDGVVAALTPEERLALDPRAPRPSPQDEQQPKQRRTPPTHGTRGKYKAGCRCEQCTAANRQYVQDLKLRKAAQPAEPARAEAACPSVSAYRRHVRLGEPIDAGCKDAWARHRATQRADERSRKVYAAWCKGLSDPQIAEQLGISIRTVRGTRERLGLIANLHVQGATR